MAHMTVSGQQPHSEHIPGFSDFRPRDRMPSYSQFDTPQATKDFIPPDPLEMRAGMYIPPEESALITHMNPSLDDFMAWSQSDEEQQDTDEDEEDNEFDMEFDDPEGMPGMPPSHTPVNPTFCARHFSQPNFSALESSSYTPRPIEPIAYPVLTRYEYEQQPGYKAPFNFINPSSLHLKNPEDVSAYIAPPASTIPESSMPASEPASNFDVEGSNVTEPMVSEEQLPPLDLTNDKAIDEFGLGLDMDFAFDEGRSESEPVEPFTDFVSPRNSPQLDEGAKVSPKPEPIDIIASNATPPPRMPSVPSTPPQQQKQPHQVEEVPVSTQLHTPPMSANEALAPEPLESSPVHDVEDLSSSPGALSPPAEKLRKRVARRSNKPSASSHHGNTHVCNMSFADGRECHRSFTRPYDLARHQETIHAPVRRTYKCDACGDKSKTFSRLDALSRHMRLKHAPSDE